MSKGSRPVRKKPQGKGTIRNYLKQKKENLTPAFRVAGAVTEIYKAGSIGTDERILITLWFIFFFLADDPVGSLIRSP